jgi:MFS-type transporter involved in bile tolerance (Atg22 family)
VARAPEIRKETVLAVPSEISATGVEWWAQLMGFLLSQLGTELEAKAFLMCGVVTWVVTLLIVLFSKQELRKTGMQQHHGSLQAGLLNG